MKNPRIYKKTREGIYTIQFYENHKRKFKSLGTKDKIKAEILFTNITGFPVPIFAKPKSGHDRPKRYLYVEAVNKFILSKWGLKDAWTVKNKPIPSSLFNDIYKE